jgi:hypothetical protein
MGGAPGSNGDLDLRPLCDAPSRSPTLPSEADSDASAYEAWGRDAGADAGAAGTGPGAAMPAKRVANTPIGLLAPAPAGCS